jgi:diguanylate cyclase (GGDEF)-like protein
MLIDVDYFKGFNDTYGHLNGDTALSSAAKVFMNTLKRPADLAARWGGEEFIVLLPNTELEGAIDIAEQIREGILKLEIHCMENVIAKVTVSIGVNTRKLSADATGSNQTGLASSIEEFISGADKALYEAKNTGRNRVCFNKE